MNTLSQTSSAEDMAAVVINTAIKQVKNNRGRTSSNELASDVEKVAKQVGTETPLINQYVAALRDSSHGSVITVLPEGVGGQFDGSTREIATSTLEVDENVTQTIARMEEVNAHELYHALNHHTDAMMTWDGSSMVVIAGKGFETREVVEALTVSETGNEFVSEEYKQGESDVISKIAEADLTMDDLRSAVNTDKDLTTLDDRSRSELVFDVHVSGSNLETPAAFAGRS